MDIHPRGRKDDQQSRRTKLTANMLPGFRASSELPEHGEMTNTSNVHQPDSTPASVSSKPVSDEEAVEEIMGKAPDTLMDEPDKKSKRPSKKSLVILCSILAFIVLGGGFFTWWTQFRNPSDVALPEDVITQNNTEDTEKKPTTKQSPLTGREVAIADADRAVTAVMIENSLEARPQSGLYEADMVFEAIAEGGITRFLALYQESQPKAIGPIRSARPYYVEWARTFDAAYVHAGGSDDGLAKINELGVKDMSAFESTTVYYRVSSKSAPHNLYASMAGIDGLRTAKGYTSSSFTPWNRKQDTPQSPTASSINFSISSPLYNPAFTYQPETNSYLRSQNGAPHTDEQSGAQINPKVIIALFVKSGKDGIYNVYQTIDEGEMLVFQDGIVSKGTWKKDSSSAQYIFKDMNGLDFVFNRGQTWVTLADGEQDVSYAP